MARLVQDLTQSITKWITQWIAQWIAQPVARLFDGLRDRPARFGYVLMALVLCVVVFSLSDYLPAPYDMSH